MGGMGSGNWYRWERKKSTVEESLVLAIRDFRGRLFLHSADTFTWTWGNGDKSSIGYFVTWGEAGPIVTLHYRWRNSEDVSIPIRMQSTPTQFGGERRWFNCPLIVGGVACNRRVGKLYLPPGGEYFGCRKCHDLTYQSSQEAHRNERGMGTLEWGDTTRRPATLAPLVPQLAGQPGNRTGRNLPGASRHKLAGQYADRGDAALSDDRLCTKNLVINQDVAWAIAHVRFEL